MDIIIEEKLLKLYTDWEEKTLQDFYALNPTEQYSKPFVSTQPFENNGKKNIMIVGQEARKFFDKGDNEDIKNISNYVKVYLQSQLNNTPHKKHPTNRSPFWNFVRELSKNNNVLWNNLDKVHKYDEDKTTSLNIKEELFLHKSFNKNDKSLLYQEIEILKPDVVLFVVGPNYKESLFTALDLNHKYDKYSKPTNNNPIIQLNVNGISSKVLWTYHPKHLTIRDLNAEVIEKIYEYM